MFPNARSFFFDNFVTSLTPFQQFMITVCLAQCEQKHAEVVRNLRFKRPSFWLSHSFWLSASPEVLSYPMLKNAAVTFTEGRAGPKREKIRTLHQRFTCLIFYDPPRV
jgi:hypothetical protein